MLRPSSLLPAKIQLLIELVKLLHDLFDLTASYLR